MLAIPFMRSLGRKMVYQPGDGPTKEQSKNDRVEYRGIGIPDVATPNPPRAYCKAAYEGSLYECKLDIFERVPRSKFMQLRVSLWDRLPSRF